MDPLCAQLQQRVLSSSQVPVAPGVRQCQSEPCIQCTTQVQAAQVQVQVLRKATDQVGVADFVPFPGTSSSSNQVLGEHTVPVDPSHLITSPVPAALFPECAMRHHLSVLVCSPLGSQSQAVMTYAFPPGGAAVQNPQNMVYTNQEPLWFGGGCGPSRVQVPLPSGSGFGACYGLQWCEEVSS